MCTGKGAVQAQSGERSIRGSVESFTEPAMYKAFFSHHFIRILASRAISGRVPASERS